MSISYNVNLYWIRHGYSCANVVRDTLGSMDILHGSLLSRSTYSPDAQLADYGKQQVEEAAKNNRNILNKIKVVLTSELRRAIETALILFKNYKDVKIYPVPYINENRNSLLEFFDLDKDNSGMGLEKLKEYLVKNYPEDYNKLDFKLLSELKGNKKETLTADVNKFFSIVLPKFIHENQTLFSKNAITNIAIVSHHKFIEDHLKKIGGVIPYINNTDMYVENVTIVLKRDGGFVSKTSKPPAECQQQITCKVSTDIVGQPIKLDNESYQRCNTDLVKRLGNTKYIPKGFKKQKGGYYQKYMKYKLMYLQLKTQYI